MKNTRIKITAFMLLSWLGFGIYGIEKGVSLVELSAYFGASVSFIGPYIWSETKRSSNASSDIGK